MKSGPQVALGLAAGYLLGRNRRMRLAIMLDAAAVTGGIGGAGGQLLRRGTELVASSEVMSGISPAVGEITGMIRGELADTAKSAALAAVSSRIDSLSDNLHSQTEALQHPADLAEDVNGRAQGVSRRVPRPRRAPDEPEEWE